MEKVRPPQDINNATITKTHHGVLSSNAANARKASQNYVEIHRELDSLSTEDKARFTTGSNAAISSPRRQTVTVNKALVREGLRDLF